MAENNAGSADTPWKINMEPTSITHLERKMIFQTSMIMFHVNLPGCTHSWIRRCVSNKKEGLASHHVNLQCKKHLNLTGTPCQNPKNVPRSVPKISSPPKTFVFFFWAVVKTSKILFCLFWSYHHEPEEKALDCEWRRKTRHEKQLRRGVP